VSGSRPSSMYSTAMQMMFSGLSSGGRRLPCETALRCPFAAASTSLSLRGVEPFDHTAHDVLRPKPRNVLHRVGHVDHFVASDHTQFEVIEEREFHVCSSELLKRRGRSVRPIHPPGLIRAFIGNLASSGRPQGGSTITQQIVKNLLVGEDLTYERKIREMIVASRVERTLSKAEILELYLNSVYLGRGSWGIELAARSYFGKP